MGPLLVAVPASASDPVKWLTSWPAWLFLGLVSLLHPHSQIDLRHKKKLVRLWERLNLKYVAMSAMSCEGGTNDSNLILWFLSVPPFKNRVQIILLDSNLFVAWSEVDQHRSGMAQLHSFVETIQGTCLFETTMIPMILILFQNFNQSFRYIEKSGIESWLSTNSLCRCLSCQISPKGQTIRAAADKVGKLTELQRPNVSKHPCKICRKVPMMVWTEIQDHHGPPHHHSDHSFLRIWWLLEVGTPRSRNTPRTPRLEAPSFEVDLWTHSIFMGFKNCLQNDVLDTLAYLGTCYKCVFLCIFSKHSSFFQTFIVGEKYNTSIAVRMFVKELIDISEKQNG